MSRLVWDAIGERFYETGIDRGVLYVDPQAGVAWNGLVSVSESPTGEDVTSLYIDGIKYAQLCSGEEFEATIEAFTYPDDFSVCIGESIAKNGLFATQQKKQTFGLSYRNVIGNDVDGADHAYKIHVIYNALAKSSPRTRASVGETIEPDNFSWAITTKPPSPFTMRTGFKPTPHFIIDTRGVDPILIGQLEDILYGTDIADPRLLEADELLSMFVNYGLPIDDGVPNAPFELVLDGGAP